MSGLEYKEFQGGETIPYDIMADVCVCESLSPRTVAHQAPLSMDFPGKNIEVGNHSLLQGIFPTQGSNLGLLHCRQTLPSEAPREAAARVLSFKPEPIS